MRRGCGREWPNRYIGTTVGIRNDGGVPLAGLARATLAIVPRETLSETAIRTAEILEKTPEDCDIIFVAAGLPPRLGEEVRALIAPRNGRYIDLGGFATPNEARNAALAQCQTRYIVYADNDVRPLAAGWFQALVDCATETGAAIVGPLTYEVYPEFTHVHLAGGEAEIIVHPDGRRTYFERHIDQFQPKPPEFYAATGRVRTGMIEFHAMLADADWLKSIGGLDPEIASFGEHWDISILAREQGKEIWFEPMSVVNYSPPRHVTEEDRRFYELRWSPQWYEHSLARLRAKHNLSVHNDPYLDGAKRWLLRHRSHAYNPLRKKLGKWLGRHNADQAVRHIYMPLKDRFGSQRLEKDLQEWMARRKHFPTVPSPPQT